MKNWKKALMLLLMFCLMAGQCIAVQAASKSSAKLVLNKTSYTLKKGKSVQLKVTKNKLGKKKKVVWSSSNEKVATVSAKGKVKGNKNGKIPMRQCVGCGEMKNKKELLRIIRTSEGEILLDATGKKNGRGAYLCPDPECFQKALKAKGLERSLKTAIPKEITENLAKEMENIAAR